MKYLSTLLILSVWLFCSCSSGGAKEDTAQEDPSLKEEILQNDSTAQVLDEIEGDISNAAQELDEALNDLEVE